MCELKIPLPRWAISLLCISSFDKSYPKLSITMSATLVKQHDFIKFCGLLRMYQLYKMTIFEDTNALIRFNFLDSEFFCEAYYVFLVLKNHIQNYQLQFATLAKQHSSIEVQLVKSKLGMFYYRK